MSPAKASNCESFKSPLLESLRTAFTRRQKSLGYSARTFSVANEPYENPSEPNERLNVDYETLESPSTHIRLSVWPDGVLWFRASQQNKRGYLFKFSFSGQLPEPMSRQVADWFEESVTILGFDSRSADCPQELLALWQPTSPQADHAV